MKRFDTINVIPFIDIMLVLLVIVLVSATFIAHGRLEVKLPRADTAAARNEPRTTEIAVDRHGTLYLGSRTITEAALQERLAELPGQTPITLRVDAEVPFERFVSIAALAQKLGLRNLAIVTEQRR